MDRMGFSREICNQAWQKMHNLLQKTNFEMSTNRDFNNAPPVIHRYCILSSQRTGSTLLGRTLYETGLAGDPLEYFNPPLLVVARKQTEKPDLGFSGFLKLIEKRRTSPNGIFGMKVHYHQLKQVLVTEERSAAFLRGFDKLIWIRRRDRVGQAISKVIAEKTQVWSSEHFVTHNFNIAA
jgi:LPS sulfotransferase NodH